MAENTRMKELTSKVDTMMIVMEQRIQREDKMMAAIDHNDERMKMLEQSIINLTSMMEHQLNSKTVGSEAPQLNSTPASITEIETAGQFEARAGEEHKGSQPFYTRSVKLDFPRFEGENVLQWIYQAEKFCRYYGVTDANRLEIASMHFDGPVVPWFQMLEKEGKVTSWAALVEALEDRYGPSILDNPEYALFKLMQDDTVDNYYTHFTELANRVDGIAPKRMLSCFISGLKKEIQREVIMWEPKTIAKAAKLT